MKHENLVLQGCMYLEADRIVRRQARLSDEVLEAPVPRMYVSRTTHLPFEGQNSSPTSVLAR